MPVIVDEHPQYVNEAGKPLVNGKIFIGVVNQDPKLNLAPIFSDRELTIPIPNPQTLDSFGRTVNKMYVDGRYSFKLEDSNGGQIEQDFDRGEIVTATIISLSNVQGINDITANATPTITAYRDKQQYTLTAVNENTGAVTLSIDGLLATPIKNQGADIAAGEFPAGEIIIVAYNSLSNVFELVGGGGLSLTNIITLWSGSIASIPVGWALCDGNNGTPDLRDSFVRGAGSTFTVDETGGSETTGSHIITIAEMPAHTHTTPSGANSTKADGDNQKQIEGSSSVTGSTGGGTGHTHPDTVPPFYALAFIMKL